LTYSFPLIDNLFITKVLALKVKGHQNVKTSRGTIIHIPNKLGQFMFSSFSVNVQNNRHTDGCE